jgi:hypothetical protein
MDDTVITIAAGIGLGSLSTVLVLGVLLYSLLKRAGLLPGAPEVRLRVQLPGAPEVRLRLQHDPKVAAAPYSTLDGEEDDAAPAAGDEDAEGADATAPRPAAKRLPVVQAAPAAGGTCAECKSFDLAGGQKILSSNPAFRAAAEWVPPWRMGRALKTKANPEYTALEAERDAAEGEARAALDKRLEVTPREVPFDEEEQVEPELLHLDWAQFGACKTHSEIRAASDCCDKFKAKGAA